MDSKPQEKGTRVLQLEDSELLTLTYILKPIPCYTIYNCRNYRKNELNTFIYQTKILEKKCKIFNTMEKEIET